MANLYFEAQLDAEQLKRELRELNNRLNGFAQNAKTQGDQIDNTFKRIGQAATGYLTLTTTKGFLDQIIQVRGEVQQLEIALESMLQSKSLSDKVVRETVQLAAKTPFKFSEIGQGTKQLIAFQVPAQEVTDTLRRLGDVAAGVSAPIGDLIRAYGQVKAKGRLQAEEINQFAERGVPLIAELSKELGVTNAEVLKLSANGEIGFDKLEKVIRNLTNEGGQFANMMEKQAASLPGLVSNLGDAWDRMLNDIGKSNQGILADGITGLTSLVDNYEEVLKVLGLIVTAYGSYKAAVVAVAMAEKAKMLATQIQEYIKMSRALGMATANQIAFNRATIMNPYVAVAAGITALVAGFVLFSKEVANAEEITKSFNDTMSEMEKQSSIEGMIEEFEVLSKKTDKTAEEQARYNQLLKDLAPLYSDAITKVDEYGNAVELSAEKMKKANRESKESLEQSLRDQILLTEKSLKKQKELAATARMGTETSYQRAGITPGSSETYYTTAESREKARAELGKVQGEIDKLNQLLEDQKTKLAVLTGEIPDYFREYSSLLGSISELSKKELEKLQSQLEGVLKTDIKDSKFKDQALAQLDAVRAAITDMGKPKPFDVKVFEKTLKEARDKYNDYESEIKVMGADYARKRYSDLLNEGDSYDEYLLKKREAYRQNEDAITAIVRAGEAAKIDWVKSEKTQMEKMASKGVVSIKINVPDYGILESYKKRIKSIDEQIFKQKDALKVAELARQKSTLESELKAFENMSVSTVDIYKKLFASIEGLRKSDLKNRLEDIDAELARLDKTSNAYVELAKQRGVVESAINDRDNETLADIKEAAQLMSNAGDEISRAIGEMVSAFSEMASALTDSSTNGLQKVTSIVSAAIVAGKQLQEIGRDSWYGDVNKQMAINEELAEQLTIEREILKIRQDRRDMELNSSAFLSPDFTSRYDASLQKMSDAEKSMDENIAALMENAVFSSKGKAKRRLIGSKSGTYSFTLEDIIKANYPEVAGVGGLGGLLGAGNYFDAVLEGDAKRALGTLLDPAGIFGGYADSKANKNAFKNLSKAFDATLKAMGKTSADIANMSTQEWVEFYSLMEASGKITDKGTKEMVANAKAAAEAYAAAQEELRQIISDVSGDLGSKLSEILVTSFENGEDAAIAFKDTVNDVLNSIFMQQLTNMMFKPYFDKLQEEMSASMDGGDGEWGDDIQRFFSNITPAIGTASDAMAAYDEQMEALGFKGFNQNLNESNSLSGAVKGVSEETASIIAGQMNAIRINQAESLKMMNLSIAHMAEVAANTRYNRYLESIDNRLARIETSDPLRAKGL